MVTDEPTRPALTRPYVLTGGRTRSAADLPLEAIVVDRASVLPVGAAPELVAIVELCGTPHSIVEIAAILGLQLGVVRVLVGDLTAGAVLSVGRDREHTARRAHPRARTAAGGCP